MQVHCQDKPSFPQTNKLWHSLVLPWCCKHENKCSCVIIDAWLLHFEQLQKNDCKVQVLLHSILQLFLIAFALLILNIFRPNLDRSDKNPLLSHTMLTMIHTKGSLHKARLTTYPISVNKWSSTLSHCTRSHCFNVVFLHLEGLSWYLSPLNPVALQNLYQRMVNGKGLSSKSQHTHTLIQTLHDFPLLSPPQWGIVPAGGLQFVGLSK